MNNCTLNALCTEHLLSFKFTPDLNLNSYIQFMLKMLEKWSTYSITSGPSKLLPYFIFTNVRLNQKWSIATISKVDMLSPHFPVLVELKIIYMFLLGKTYFPFCNLFLTNAMSQASHYSIAISMENVQLRFLL